LATTGQNWLESLCDERQRLSLEVATAAAALMRLQVGYQIARSQNVSNLYDLLMRISVARECRDGAERMLQNHIKQHQCHS